jgi:HlyD family secretion protein
VTFTVDAFPGETFKGQVGKIRLNAAMTQNVVTYTVEIATDNSDGRLLPYLTANVQFQLQQLTNVLQAPNAALRWNPPAKEGETESGRKKEGLKEDKKPASAKTKSGGILWVLGEDRKPRKIEVQTGASDGINTAVESADLREGMQVITGIRLPESGKGKSEGGNPFTPNLTAGGKKAKGDK